MMNAVYEFKISSQKFYIYSLSIKRFHPYFELLYFNHHQYINKAQYEHKLW